MRTQPPPAVAAPSGGSVVLAAFFSAFCGPVADLAAGPAGTVIARAAAGMPTMIALGSRTASGAEMAITRGSRGAPGNATTSIP